MIKEAIKSVNELKAGDTRTDVERSFEYDGGIQFRKTSRYSFKKCLYIKIDVEFSPNGDDSAMGFSSSDIVVQVSKPYLESPFTD